MIERTGRLWSALTIAAAVLGAIVLAVSNQQARLWWMFPLFIVGMGLVSLSLLSLNESIEQRMRRQPTVPFPKFCSVLLILGALMVTVSVAANGRPWLPIAGMILVVLGSSGLSVWVKGRLAPDQSPPAPSMEASDLTGTDELGSGDEKETLKKMYEQRSEPVMEVVAGRLPRIGVGSLAWYGFESMAVGVGLLLINDGVTSLIGVVLWLVGLATAKFGVQPYLSAQGRELPRQGRVLIDASLGGLFVLFIGAFGGSLLLVLLGGSVMILAVSLLGITALEIVNVVAAPDAGGRHRQTFKMVIVAVFLAGFTFWYVAWVTTNAGMAFVLMVLMVSAGMWFVFRGEWIMIALLTGYVLSWGLVDRSDPLSVAVAAEVATKPVSMVVVGDSFASGEGARRFLDGTNDVDGNQCRRAPTAYPYLVAAAFEVNVASTACSGAKIADLTTCGQMWPSGRRCRDAGWEAPPDDVPLVPAGALPQLIELDRRTAAGRTIGENGVEVPPLEVDVVVVSIGGNDVGFSSIVKACLLPKGCDERREFWLNRIEGLRPQLADLYQEIADRFEDATVVVMPYPMLVDENTNRSCDLGLSKDEREFVVDFIDKLDGVIESAAASADVTYLAEAKGAFSHAKLCDDPAAANHVRIVPPAGHQLGRYEPSTWIPGSMHPNELGHQRTAAVLCREVATITDRELPARCEKLLEAIPDTEADSTEVSTPEGVNLIADTAAIDDASDRCAALLEGAEATVSDETSSGGPEDTTSPTTQTTAVPAAEETNDAPAVPEDVEAELDAAADERCAVGEAVDLLSGQVSAVTDELLSDDEWIRDELFRTVRALALPLTVFVASGLLLAAGLVRIDTPLVNFLSGRQRRDSTG